MITGTAAAEEVYEGAGGPNTGGDLFGQLGDVTVTRIRNKPVPAPGAPESLKAFYYDHGTGAFIFRDPVAATSGVLGAVKMVGNVADAAAPKARSADDFQLAALAADVGPIAAETNLQNITGLGVAVGASATEIWLVKFWLLVNAANATMDVKFGFNTAPAACVARWGAQSGGDVNTVAGWGGIISTGATALAMKNQNQTLALSTAVGYTGVPLVAVVFGGGTAGTLQLQYAQNTSDAGNLIIAKGSAMEAARLVA